MTAHCPVCDNPFTTTRARFCTHCRMWRGFADPVSSLMDERRAPADQPAHHQEYCQMSGTGVKQIAIALMLPFLPNGKPDKFVAFVAVQNSDETAPTVAIDPSSPVANAISLDTQPIANDGSNAAKPAATYPWMFSGAAANVGAAILNVLGDGVLAEQITFNVQQRGPEVPDIETTDVIITPGG